MHYASNTPVLLTLVSACCLQQHPAPAGYKSYSKHAVQLSTAKTPPCHFKLAPTSRNGVLCISHVTAAY